MFTVYMFMKVKGGGGVNFSELFLVCVKTPFVACGFTSRFHVMAVMNGLVMWHCL